MGKIKGLLPVLLLLGATLVAYWSAREWQASRYDFSRELDGIECDFMSGPCVQTWAGGEVAFIIDPAATPLMRPLTLIVDPGTLDPDQVEVVIRGLNMEMGLNRTALAASGKRRWTGETILPICTQRRMKWEAAVRFVGDKRIEIPFIFYTLRD